MQGEDEWEVERVLGEGVSHGTMHVSSYDGKGPQEIMMLGNQKRTSQMSDKIKAFQSNRFTDKS